MGGNEGLYMEVRRSGWKIGDETNEREGGIIEGKRENKGSREINKKTMKKRVGKTLEKYIYIYTRPTFLKRIDL